MALLGKWSGPARMQERWGAGIPKIVFSAKGLATGFPSHPFSYKMGAFPATLTGCGCLG